MKIASTKEIHLKPHYVLVYGCSGIGKTSLVRSLPTNTLILDAESGLSVLKNTDFSTISLSQDDDGQLLDEKSRFRRLVEFMNFVRQEETKEKYKYLFIDSLTEISQNLLKHLKDEKNLDGFKLWGEYTTEMVNLIKFFRDLNHYTIIFTALEDRMDEEDGGKSYFVPNVGGKKVKEYLLPSFDIVMRMIVDPEGNRKLVTKPTLKTQAKDRPGALEALEEPNLMAILEKSKGV